MANKRVAFDAGHGINTPGKRTPSGEREWSFNNKVILAAINRLSEYDGVDILRLDDPTGNTDVSLINRTTKANNWGANILISFHHNAFQGVWGGHGGTETIIWNGNYASKSETKRLATMILNNELQAYGLANRGVKESDLHMLRESNMMAVLVEGGFMDSTIDIKKLRDDNVLKNAGVAVADTVAQYLGLKLKYVAPPVEPIKPIDELYRIRKAWGDEKTQIGAYSNLQSAIEVSKRVADYKVFNEKGIQVYPEIKPTIEPPLTQEELKKVRALIK